MFSTFFNPQSFPLFDSPCAANACYSLCVMNSITQLNEAELEETFSRSSGPGGQNVNKVSTKVTLRHIPTNVSVTIQETRTQAENRKLARRRLLEALQAREREARNAIKDRREKLRRQNSKRPRGLKERILRSKKHRAGIKKDRRVGGGD